MHGLKKRIIRPLGVFLSCPGFSASNILSVIPTVHCRDGLPDIMAGRGGWDRVRLCNIRHRDCMHLSRLLWFVVVWIEYNTTFQILRYPYQHSTEPYTIAFLCPLMTRLASYIVCVNILSDSLLAPFISPSM